MMSFNIRAKSALLACAVVASTSNVSAAISNPFPGIIASVNAHKQTVAAVTLSTIVSFLAILKVRLDTKPKGEYSYENWQTEVADLLNCYNIFDAESRATLKAFADKYFVGCKFKKEEVTTRVKNDDGSVVAIKANKVVQKPKGFMGLLDAYVLMQAKDLTELVPALASLYVLVKSVDTVWGKATKAAEGTKSAETDKPMEIKITRDAIKELIAEVKNPG